VANDEGTVKGCKLRRELIGSIQENWGKGLYRYRPTIGQRGILKARIYCAVIYYIFKNIDGKHKEVDLVVCRDFAGHENNIKQNLRHFLEKLDGRIIKSIKFDKLPTSSSAHGYAYLMAKDKHNLLPTYVNINLEEIEKFLKKPTIKSKRKKNKSRV